MTSTADPEITVDSTPTRGGGTAPAGPVARPGQHVALYLELPDTVESVVDTVVSEPGPPMLTVTLGTVTLDVALPDRGQVPVTMADVLAARDLAAAFHTYAVAVKNYLEGFDAAHDHQAGPRAADQPPAGPQPRA